MKHLCIYFIVLKYITKHIFDIKYWYPKYTKLKVNNKETTHYKNGQRPEQISHHRRHTDGQRVDEKMLYTTCQWGDANRSHAETSLRAHRKGATSAVVRTLSTLRAVGSGSRRNSHSLPLLPGMPCGRCPAQLAGCFTKAKLSHHRIRQPCSLVFTHRI